MQTIDTRLLGAEQTTHSCSVCIVGAGAAGLYLGVRLAELGLDVILLEAGGRVAGDAESVGLDCAFEGEAYRGATEGRYFGLGGATSRWGGALVPHTESDLRQTANGEFDPWRQIVADVQHRSRDVLRTLGLDAQSDDTATPGYFLGKTADDIRACGLAVVMARYLPFRKKNMAFLLKRSRRATGRLRLFLHAVAAHWEIRADRDGTARIDSVTVRSAESAVTICARSFVLAAGAIESTRILLEMQQGAGSAPIGRGAAVGRYLADHLSCPIAEVAPDQRALAARLFAPRFRRGWMRSFRFVQPSAPAGAPRYFAHFDFQNENAGFQLAKDLLGALQSRSMPAVSPGAVIAGAKGILALAWDYGVRSRLFIPADTPVHLQMDIEQQPHGENRIRLADELDARGRPRAVIQWRVRTNDEENIRSTALRFLSLWPGARAGLPELRSFKDIASSGTKLYDAYHPVGTCRMGNDRESVVDPELKVHGMSNLSILSTAVFPTAGTANPTFSMLCLGEALAHRLQEHHR